MHLEQEQSALVGSCTSTGPLSETLAVMPFAEKSYKLQKRSARVDICCSTDPI